MDNDTRYEKHLRKREELLKAHEQGKLSKSFYDYNQQGQRRLSPRKLWSEGY
jgi:hypothetical protein